MKGEILSLETAEKLARIDKTIKYIKETTYSDRNSLKRYSIMELWFIEDILKILEGNDG